LLQKGSQQAEKDAVQFILNHKMTGTGPMDASVFKALYSVRQPLSQKRDAPVTSALGLLAGCVRR
jgi:hypothetical protein